MSTAQESPNGHQSFPPPVSAENPAGLNPADLPANQDNINQFPASAYHVPPGIYVPKAHAYRSDDHLDRPHLEGPLPGRCQFMFSDGRQCTMARSEIHPSLCVYHSEREEQLFGDPFCESHIRGRSYDLPELFSASRDLSTAAGVNRALGQVFRLLAQRRISRQEAATFGHLAKLLLQSIRAARAESAEACVESLSRGPEQPMREGVILSESASAGESHGHQELSSVNKVESKDLSVPPPARVNSSTPPIAASPEPPSQRVAMSNPRKISTSTTPMSNSSEISTYKNAELHPIQNQHLQKSRNGMPPNNDQPNNDQESGFPGAPSFATLTQASRGD
jgi:hypothetical protein